MARRWQYLGCVGAAGASREESGVVPKLDAVHPVLMARDIPTSVCFFEALGFSLAFQDDESDPRYAAVVRDGVELHLQWHDASQLAHPGDRPAYRFLVREVDALHAELRSRGVFPEQV